MTKLKMSKPKIVSILTLAFILLGIFLVDEKYFAYHWYRVINGSSVSPSEGQLGDGFFIQSQKNDEFILMHRDYMNSPLLVRFDGKADYVKLEGLGLVTVVAAFEGCTVYKNVKAEGDYYLDSSAAIKARIIVGVNHVHDNYLKRMCNVFR